MKSLAEKKKKENIVEYILYMYRMEDLLRAYRFSMDDIDQYFLAHAKISKKEKTASHQWLENMAMKMEKHGVKKEGHLPSTQRYVDALAKIHWELVKSDRHYFRIYQKAKPVVMDFIMAAGNKNPGHEVQVFVNGLYGLLLSRLNGKQVSPEMSKAAEIFGEALGYLSLVYMGRQMEGQFKS
jgi:sulfur relay (sulfurtransferase) DsrC/TusE family protein